MNDDKIVKSEEIALFLLTATAFFLPIATAPVNVFGLLSLLAVFSSKKLRGRLPSLLSEPIVVFILLFFALVVLSGLSRTSESDEYWIFVNKYARFLFIPFYSLILNNDEQRNKVIHGFLLGVLLSMVGSYLVYFGLLEGHDDTYFKLRITHGFFIVIGLLWLFDRFMQRFKVDKQNATLLVLGLLAVVNVFIVTDGRTGWLAFAAALFFYFVKNLSFKKLLQATALMAVVFGLLYVFSSAFSDRIDSGVQQILFWLHGGAGSNQTSMGQRMNFWFYSLKAIQLHPVFGYGAGGFVNAVNQFSSEKGFFSFGNPHNQFLLILVQFGFVGFLVYLSILFFTIKKALSSNFCVMALVAFWAGCLVNSFNLDFAESYFFVIMSAMALSMGKGNSEQRIARQPHL